MLLFVQAGDDTTGLTFTAGFGQPAYDFSASGTKILDETTPKPSLSTATGIGGEGRRADDPATLAEGAILSSAASLPHHGAAFPASSRLTRSNDHVSMQKAGLCSDDM